MTPKGDDLRAPGRSLAEELEQQRLNHRAARIRRTLGSLRTLAAARGAATPTATRLWIADLEGELARIEARRAQLPRPPAPVAAPRGGRARPTKRPRAIAPRAHERGGSPAANV